MWRGEALLYGVVYDDFEKINTIVFGNNTVHLFDVSEGTLPYKFKR